MSTYFHQMLAAEARAARARKTIWIAAVLSLLIHAGVLFVHISRPEHTGPSSDGQANRHVPLSATLGRRAPQLKAVQPPAPASSTAKAAGRNKQQTKVLTSKNGGKWSRAQKQEMDQFIKELTPPKPATGRELAERALAAARGMRSDPQQDEINEAVAQQAKRFQSVEPFSLQMYFDSFIRKLNRSAAFVKQEAYKRGSRKALVELAINADGSLKNYRILRAADQQAEIAYIRSVVDRAVPFAAFPADIRKGTDTLSLLICIYPPNSGDMGGGFSRSFDGGECRD